MPRHRRAVALTKPFRAQSEPNILLKLDSFQTEIINGHQRCMYYGR